MIFEIDDIVTIKAPNVPRLDPVLFRIFIKRKKYGWWVYSIEEYPRPTLRAVYTTTAYGSDLTLVRRGDPCDCEPTKKFKPKCLDCVLKRFP
jgi:hypothetical protein